MTQPGESDIDHTRRGTGESAARVLDNLDDDYVRLHDEALQALIKFARHLNATGEWEKPQLGAALGGLCGGIIAAAMEEL
jgi:uncharacterized protein (DUF2336 family)